VLITGESTVSDVPFQLGDPDFDYNVTVQVHVFDRIGDKSIFSTDIRVLFPQNFQINFYTYVHVKHIYKIVRKMLKTKKSTHGTL
jgi:hypothetical protein